MADYTLGIDIGTSGVKAGLLNLATLKLEHVAGRGYPSTPEQDLETIWAGTLAVASAATGKLGPGEQVRAIGLSGQMHGTVLYDAQSSVLGPLINWQDKRCDRPLARYGGRTTIEVMVEILGPQGFEDLGINAMASGFLGATLFYLKENEPALFAQVRHALLPTDYIRGRLLGAGDYATDQTNAFGSGLFNTRLNCWHAEFMAKLGLPPGIFPAVHDTAGVAGGLSEAAALRLGLSQGIPVIYGGGDNQMSMLGSGLASPESPPLINIGTACQLSKVIAGYRKLDGIDTRSFFCGRYALVGASLGGGASYQWLRDAIREREGVWLEFARLDELAAQVAPGAGGLRFCTGPTRRDPQRRLGFYGRSEGEPSLGQRARAVLEGVLLDLYAFYQSLGGDQHQLMMAAGNGLQKSRVWSQMAADVFGKRLRITDFENAVFGAAVMAAWGTDHLDDLEHAMSCIEYREVAPDPAACSAYRELIGAALKS